MFNPFQLLHMMVWVGLHCFVGPPLVHGTTMLGSRVSPLELSFSKLLSERRNQRCDFTRNAASAQIITMR